MPSKFLPFDEALTMVQSLGLANKVEWKAWCKEGMRPPNVPAAPDTVYTHDGWQGWGHWLGTGNGRGRPCKRGATNTGGASKPKAKRQR